MHVEREITMVALWTAPSWRLDEAGRPVAALRNGGHCIDEGTSGGLALTSEAVSALGHNKPASAAEIAFLGRGERDSARGDSRDHSGSMSVAMAVVG